MNMLKRLGTLLRGQKGQGLVEYALLVCLISIVVGGALIVFGQYLVFVFRHFVDMIAVWCH